MGKKKSGIISPANTQEKSSSNEEIGQRIDNLSSKFDKLIDVLGNLVQGGQSQVQATKEVTTKPVKINPPPKKTKNKFEAMSEFYAKPELAQEKFNNFKPADRTRESGLVKVSCNQCKKKDEVNASILVDDPSSPKNRIWICNDCMSNMKGSGIRNE